MNIKIEPKGTVTVTIGDDSVTVTHNSTIRAGIVSAGFALGIRARSRLRDASAEYDSLRHGRFTVSGYVPSQEFVNASRELSDALAQVRRTYPLARPRTSVAGLAYGLS